MEKVTTFFDKSKSMLEESDTTGGKLALAIAYTIGFAGLAVWFFVMAIITLVGAAIAAIPKPLEKKEVDSYGESLYNYESTRSKFKGE